MSDLVVHNGVLLRELRAQQVVWGRWYFEAEGLEDDIELRSHLNDNLRALSLARSRVEAHCVATGAELALVRREVLWCNDSANEIKDLGGLQMRVQQVSVFTGVYHSFF